MPDVLAARFDESSNLDELLGRILSSSLDLMGAPLGNVQLMNWKSGHLSIAAQRGFREPFLEVFRSVRADDGAACGQALRRRSPVVIEDVLDDAEFAPFREVALEAGFRAVQSTPLVSSNGAFVGMVSTHFDARHRPLDTEMATLRSLAEVAANGIVRERLRAARERDGHKALLNKTLTTSTAAIASSYELLQRVAAWESRK
jgi:GAF domain-containing protein